MRKQITPKLLHAHTRTETGHIKLVYIDKKEEELNQYIIKNKKTELALVEMDQKNNKIRSAYFLKLAVNSKRVTFAAYKEFADPLLVASELDSLIENIVANIRNDQLIKKISHTFESYLINHLRGESFGVDSYDDELLNTGFDVREIFVSTEEGKIGTLKNDKVFADQMKAQKQKTSNQHGSLESKLGVLNSATTASHIAHPPLPEIIVLQPENTQGSPVLEVVAHPTSVNHPDVIPLIQSKSIHYGQPDAGKLKQSIDIASSNLAPVDQPKSVYGIDKTSIPAEVYSNFEKKLTELLSNVYLEGNTEWVFVEEIEGIKLWRQDHPTYVIQRSELELPFSLETAKKYLCDGDFRYKYDELLRSFEVIKTYSEQVSIMRVVIKGKLMFSDRDFVTCRACFYQNRDVSIGTNARRTFT